MTDSICSFKCDKNTLSNSPIARISITRHFLVYPQPYERTCKMADNQDMTTKQVLLKMFYNTFKTQKINYLSNGTINHCTTICPHKNSVIIAMYSGTRECAADQRVYIQYKNTIKHLEEKTGNPVLWNHNGITYLLYSKFEDMKLTTINRWKYCSLWVRTINYEKNKLILGIPMQLSTPDQHLLGRCSPIDNILPLYDEVNRQGIIIDLSQNTEIIGRIGVNMIQPCIWKENNIYHSLSRNFGIRNTTLPRSKYSYSTDCINWSIPKTTVIPNNNSSLCTINWNGKQLILFNNTHKINRIDLTLGTIIISDENVIVRDKILISDFGGYPSMCIDSYNRLHMVYTNSSREITHRVWNWKYYLKGIQ